MAGLLGDGEGILGMDPYALAQIYSLMTAQKGQNVGLTISTIAQQQERARAMKQEQQMNALKYQEAQRMQQQGDADRNAYSAAPDFSAPSAPNMAPTPENAKQLKAPTPYEQASKMVEYLRGKGVSQAYIKPYLDQMEKFRPKGKADQQLVKLPDGSLGLINIMDDGSSQIVPYSPAEKQKEVNLGDRVQMTGEYSGAPGQSFGMGIGPDAQMRDATTRRGQDMVDARTRDRNAQDKPKLYDGPNGPLWVTPPGSGPTQPVIGPDGQPIGAKKRDQPLTEAQGNATAYAMRAQQSEEILGKLQKSGFNPASFWNVPNRLAGGSLNVLASDSAQQYNAAKKNFVTAVLRKESGAAISQSEFDNEDQKYFPQPGDGPGVIQQKAQARKLAIEALKIQSGAGGRQQGAQAGGWAMRQID